jgi:3-oxoacyl-[acyl-carrier protein] reductase
MDLELEGRKALVTGASRGIGRAIALALTAEGANVTAVARNQENLQSLADEARSTRGAITVHAANVATAAAIQSLTPALQETDILVFNTGGPPFGLAADIADETWSAQFEAMFLSAMRLTRLALPGMRKRLYGRILLVVSSGVVQPIPNLAISNSLRAALVGWAKTLSGEVAAESVTVNCLAPGRIATDRLMEFDQNRARREGVTVEEVQKQSRATIPAGRYGEPAEMAAVAAFLASPRAGYMTGNVIRVDGGMVRCL